MLTTFLNKIFGGKNNYPPIGTKIKITWLPYNNAYPNKNCYIGEIGICDEICADYGGFWIRLESGASLFVGNKFKFEYVN